MRIRPIRILALLIVGYAIALALRAEPPSDDSPATVPGPPQTGAQVLRDPAFRVAGVHYWQGNWNYNFWSNLRLAAVPEDLRRIRDLHFNAIVMTVPWGLFQPRADPVTYDDELYERLAWVIDEAWSAGLYTILRVGTPEHVPAGVFGSNYNVPHLYFDDAELTAYADLYRETAARLAGKPGVLFFFFSWEDVTAYLRIGQLGEAERIAYAKLTPGWTKHLRSRPLAEWNREWSTAYTSYDEIGVPPYGSLPFREFLRFADERLLEVVLPTVTASAKRGDPDVRLSYEVRIDGEPINHPDGEREYFGHELTWPLTDEIEVVSAYFNPYWGAPNQNDFITPSDALRNFRVLLRNLRRVVGDKRLFFDQFNFVDSTPAYRHNSRLENETEVATFLSRALPLLREQSLGYALWSLDAYEGNVLYNSRFEQGLERWQPMDGVDVGVGPDGEEHYAALPPHTSITQDVRAGWNPGVASPEVPYTLRLRARGAAGSALTVSFDPYGGSGGGATSRTIHPSEEWSVFTWEIPFAPGGRLTVSSTGDAKVEADDFSLFNHVQELALFDAEGQPVGQRDRVVARENARWLQRPPSRATSAATEKRESRRPENDGWLSKHASIPLSIPSGANAVELELYLPEIPAWKDGNEFEASMAGEPLGTFRVTAGASRVVVPLPPDGIAPGTQMLRLEFRRTFVPAEHEPASTDERSLACVLRAARAVSPGDESE